MQIGQRWRVAALAVVGLGGCFNPSGGADGSATAATTEGPVSTTTSGSTSEPMSSSAGSGPTTGAGPGPTSTSVDPTTGEVCMSECLTTITGTGTSTGPDTGTTDTGSDGTTSDPPVINDPVAFVPSTQAFMGAFGVAVVDFDGDPWPDVIVTSWNSAKMGVAYDGQISSLMSYGGATATAITTIDIAAHPAVEVAIASGGVTGKLDTYYLDQGTPKLGSGVALPMGCKDPTTIDAGLINVDEHPDLVIGCEDLGATALVITGNADGSFEVPVPIPLAVKPSTIALYPVVGAPLPDLVIAGKVSLVVYEGLDMGMFATDGDTFLVEQPQGLGAGDVDGDGALDVVVGQQVPGQCRVLVGDGMTLELGAVDPCGPFTHDVEVADLNADGFADLISAHDDGLHIGFSQGDGTFSLALIYATPEARRLAIADMNGDDKPDILVTSEDTVSLYLQES